MPVLRARAHRRWGVVTRLPPMPPPNKAVPRLGPIDERLWELFACSERWCLSRDWIQVCANAGEEDPCRRRESSANHSGPFRSGKSSIEPRYSRARVCDRVRPYARRILSSWSVECCPKKERPRRSALFPTISVALLFCDPFCAGLFRSGGKEVAARVVRA